MKICVDKTKYSDKYTIINIIGINKNTTSTNTTKSRVQDNVHIQLASSVSLAGKYIMCFKSVKSDIIINFCNYIDALIVLK